MLHNIMGLLLQFDEVSMYGPSYSFLLVSYYRCIIGKAPQYCGITVGHIRVRVANEEAKFTFFFIRST